AVEGYVQRRGIGWHLPGWLNEEAGRSDGECPVAEKIREMLPPQVELRLLYGTSRVHELREGVREVVAKAEKPVHAAGGRVSREAVDDGVLDCDTQGVVVAGGVADVQDNVGDRGVIEHAQLAGKLEPPRTDGTRDRKR